MNNPHITIRVMGEWKCSSNYTNQMLFFLESEDDVLFDITSQVVDLMGYYWGAICPESPQLHQPHIHTNARLQGAESFTPGDLAVALSEVFKLDIVVKEEPHDT